MLKKILQALLKPNHQPEMIISKPSSSDPFIQQTGEALVVDLINRFWVNNKSASDHYAKAVVKNIAEKMMEDCRQVLAATDPIMTNRQLLAESVLRCAKFQVMLISPVPEHDGTGLRGQLGITGELKPKILEIIKSDKEFFASFPEGLKFDQASAQIQYAYRRSWANMNIFEGLRHEFDDIHPEQSQDWFRPFFASQCAYAESLYREELGMPIVQGTEGNADALAGKMYGAYREMVLNGDKFPDQTWEARHPNLVNPKTVWKD